MDKWIFYALISAVFAGFTSVIAKLGLAGISAELGLFIRTCFVFIFVIIFAGIAVPRAQLATIAKTNLYWLGLSGITTAASWIMYYKALKLGEVSTVALIDKGSFIVAVVLAAILLKEQITARVMLGSGLILSGLIIVSRR